MTVLVIEFKERELLVSIEDIFFFSDSSVREKYLKNWNRQWKIDLIEDENPDWNDIAGFWFDKDPESSSG